MLAVDCCTRYISAGKVEEMGAEESDEFETEGSDLGDGAEREQDPAVLLALELSKEEVSRLTETVDSLNEML